jgi:hypothetical protein
LVASGGYLSFRDKGKGWLAGWAGWPGCIGAQQTTVIIVHEGPTQSVIKGLVANREERCGTSDVLYLSFRLLTNYPVNETLRRAETITGFSFFPSSPDILLRGGGGVWLDGLGVG